MSAIFNKEDIKTVTLQYIVSSEDDLPYYTQSIVDAVDEFKNRDSYTILNMRINDVIIILGERNRHVIMQGVNE